MARNRNYEGQDCSVARALELIGERWSLLIVRDAFYGVRRYNDFLAHLDVPRAVLASRLQSLVDAGVLSRQQYSHTPPREEYLLTERGIALWPVLYSLSQWGENHLVSGGCRRIFLHVRCGEPIDGNGFCPGCACWIPPAELEVRRGPGNRNLRQDAVSVALREPHRLLEPLALSTV